MNKHNGKLIIKFDISHIFKFEKTHFHIWKHRLTLLFKNKKNFGPYIINRIKVKPFVPTTIQIGFGVQTIPSIGARGER